MVELANNARVILDDVSMLFHKKTIASLDSEELISLAFSLERQLAEIKEQLVRRNVISLRKQIEEDYEEQKESKANYYKLVTKSPNEKDRLIKKFTNGLDKEISKLVKIMVRMELDIPDWQRMTKKQLQNAITGQLTGKA